MLVTAPYPTRFLLVALQPYTPYPGRDKLEEFTFAGLELIDSTLMAIGQFKNDWRQGKKHEIQLHSLPNLQQLIHADYIHHLAELFPQENPHIKFDSYCFQKKPLSTKTPFIYSIRGQLLLEHRSMSVQINRIPDGDILPSIIFRSAPIPYSSIQILVDELSSSAD